MWAWIPKLLSFVPLLGGLFEKWTENKSRAAELRAEKELVEAKAFAKGRIGPKYLLRYVLVCIFTLFALGFLGHAFFPSAFPHSPLADLREILKMAGELLLSEWW